MQRTATPFRVLPPSTQAVVGASGEICRRAHTPLDPRTKSAQEIDDETDQEDQAQPSSTDEGPSKVKSAAAEQEKKKNYQED